MQIDMNKFRPIQDRVLIEVDAAEDKTPGGIHIPESARKGVTRGVVRAVGPGKMSERGVFVETRLKVGDRVVFGKYSGNEFEDAERRTLRLCSEDDVYGVIE